MMARSEQERAKRTRERLFAAAERVFVREGFEKARLDEIAAEAGRTKGAVYAHFEGKEHLFLSLLEQRMTAAAARTLAFIARETGGRPERFKEALRTSFVELHDPAWAILHLELKLHAMRNPTSRDRLRRLYRRAYDSMQVAVPGSRALPASSSVRNWLSVLSTFVSAVVLDMYFAPDLMTLPEARRILGEVFDGLSRDQFPEDRALRQGAPRHGRKTARKAPAAAVSKRRATEGVKPRRSTARRGRLRSHKDR